MEIFQNEKSYRNQHIQEKIINQNNTKELNTNCCLEEPYFQSKDQLHPSHSTPYLQFQGAGNSEKNKKLTNYNRKERSLELLSKRFVDAYQGLQGQILELNKASFKLQMERRRTYDILNILTSLNVVTKAGKNTYKWRGLKYAISTIEQFIDVGEQFQKHTNRRKKSLEDMTSTFMKLFLSLNRTLTLEEAARYMFGKPGQENNKMKIRRLYDIANVFKSLGLLRKVTLRNGKHGFEWTGTSQLIQVISEKRRESKQQRKKVCINNFVVQQKQFCFIRGINSAFTYIRENQNDKV